MAKTSSRVFPVQYPKYSTSRRRGRIGCFSALNPLGSSATATSSSSRNSSNASKTAKTARIVESHDVQFRYERADAWLPSAFRDLRVTQQWQTRRHPLRLATIPGLRRQTLRRQVTCGWHGHISARDLAIQNGLDRKCVRRNSVRTRP